SDLWSAIGAFGRLGIREAGVGADTGATAGGTAATGPVGAAIARDMEVVPDAQVIDQKILSCVARVKERFGINYVAQVLQGAATEVIRAPGPEKVSTYGLLKEHDRLVIQDWMRQLVSQRVLMQEGDEYPI